MTKYNSVNDILDSMDKGEKLFKKTKDFDTLNQEEKENVFDFLMSAESEFENMSCELIPETYNLYRYNHRYFIYTDDLFKVRGLNPLFDEYYSSVQTPNKDNRFNALHVELHDKAQEYTRAITNKYQDNDDYGTMLSDGRYAKLVNDLFIEKNHKAFRKYKITRRKMMKLLHIPYLNELFGIGKQL